jgi:hypothetical protein
VTGERELHVDRSPTHCPYCKGEIEDLSKVVACAACGARHHQACHADHGRCATCGSAEALVPKAHARPRRRSEPLPGSSIKVREDGAAVILSWPATRWSPVRFLLIGAALLALAAAAIALVGPPPMIVLPGMGGVVLCGLFLFARSQPRTLEIGLGLDAIDFPEVDPRAAGGTLSVRAKREEVGSVRTENTGNGYRLTIDLGLVRHVVKLGAAFAPGALSEPEIDWLARAIDAWREES